MAGGRSTVTTVTPSRSAVVRNGIARGAYASVTANSSANPRSPAGGDVQRARAVVAAHPGEVQQAGGQPAADRAGEVVGLLAPVDAVAQPARVADVHAEALQARRAVLG